MEKSEKPRPHCNFCGKMQQEVRRIIAGPGVYICDSCVNVCRTILDREERKAGEPPKVFDRPIESVERIKAMLGVLKADKIITQKEYTAKMRMMIIQEPESGQEVTLSEPPAAKKQKAKRRLQD